MAGLHPSTRDTHAQIAFIDFSLVLKPSEAGKALSAYATPREQALQEAAEAKLKEVKQQQEDLEKQQSSMAAADYHAKTVAPQQKINTWNAQHQKSRAELDTTISAAMQKFQAALRAQVEAIAQENNLEAVLPVGQAFYAQPKLDLTSEAIRRLDEKLGKEDLGLPEGK